MQIDRHLQKISSLETESYSGGVCLSSNIKETKVSLLAGSDYLSNTTSKAPQAAMNSPHRRKGLNSVPEI